MRKNKNGSLRALVTGGSGFIGSHLVEALLKRGYKVTIFDTVRPIFTPQVKFIKGDISNRKIVFEAMKDKDIVFHLAGVLGTHETVEIAHKTSRVNILGALNIFDAARKYGVEVIDIAKPNYWRNPYTITKVAAEEFGLMYRDEFGLDFKAVRWFNIFGPRQRTDCYQKAAPTFIVRALKNEPLPIFGDGTQGTDHLYVSDAVEACILATESKKEILEPVEVGSGEEITVNELAEKIIKLTKSQSKLEYLPMRMGETEHTRIKADVGLLKSLGFKQKVSLDQGLLKTINYYRELI